MVQSHPYGTKSSEMNVIYFELQSNTGGSPGELSEELVTYEKQKKGWRMSSDVDKATEGLENEF